ncbi:DNA dC-_dU-editing enzyme APOBEC-3G-like [Bufo gargarizans]|uniref:DNA dC->dU-editing enzyme APOBEC-3G-like n=1 Tax=Bufo gargarizans TaxID=30331 RepID=UPI001CF2FD87|nr:DNA dC->dU-editing enzyme APOBEC-3G-like [Bufo gargarizans]
MILMPPDMFYSHYGLHTHPPATHLCYEVYDQSTLIYFGHLTNTEESHAEEVFLGERFRDAWKQCTLVWYISWSPCDRCLQILLKTFLPNNPHVKLHIIFAKVYDLTSKTMVRELHENGVNIRVMSKFDKVRLGGWGFNFLDFSTDSVNRMNFLYQQTAS